MDGQMLEDRGYRWMELMGFYRVTNIRFTLVYATSAIVAITGIWQQVRTGHPGDQQTAEEIGRVVSGVQRLVSGGRGP
jgi:hypothetical protein